MSKEAQILGDLLPSHPDILPIIEAIREKYNLPEITDPEDSIQEVFLNDEPVTFEEFRREIKSRLLENLDFLPPDIVKQYKASKSISEMGELQDIALLPNSWKSQIEAFVNLLKGITKPIYQLLDAQLDNIVNMIYVYLLTGETLDAPSDWFSKVATIESSENKIIFAMASQASDPEAVVAQFRAEYKKAFGAYRPKITKTAVTTAYYLQLRKAKKPWNFIVEEYIKRSNVYMPKDRSSKRYAEVWRKNAQLLKKRMQRTEKILDELVRDKK
jgi:hypothetical protein